MIWLSTEYCDIQIPVTLNNSLLMSKLSERNKGQKIILSWERKTKFKILLLVKETITSWACNNGTDFFVNKGVSLFLISGMYENDNLQTHENIPSVLWVLTYSHITETI